MATVGQALTAPESGWTRYEQSDSRFKYQGGSWSDNPGSNYSGGTARYTFSPDLHSVTFKFNGTALRIISYRDSDRQSNVSVVIDGQSDSYSANGVAAGQVLLFEKKGLSNGTHDVTISATNSGFFSIFEFDAIDLIGSLTLIGQQLTSPETGWQRVDSAAQISYVGAGWNTYTNASYYKGACVASNTIGDKIKFSFYGSMLRIIDLMDVDRGTASVSIDGGAAETYSTLAASSLFQRLVYEKKGLTIGIHTVEITLETSGYIGLDAIDIDSTGWMLAQVGQQLTAPEPTWLRVSNTDSHIAYLGSGWASYSHTNYEGGSTSASSNSDAKVVFRFYGTKFRIIELKETNRTTINIKIDGSDAGTYNPQGSPYQYQTLVYEIVGLALGVHTVELSLAGTGYIGVDAIDIDATGYMVAQVGQRLTAPEPGWRRYDDIHPSIKYAGGGWATVTNDPNTYAGTGHYMTLSGATTNSISFKFYGKNLRIIDLYYTNRVSNVKVSVDGVRYSYNPNNALNSYQLIVFEALNLPLSTHEVVITTDSTSNIFSIDAIDIDATGYLIHPDEVTNPKELTVGKRIRCYYEAPVAGSPGAFRSLGNNTLDLLPASPASTPSGAFYLICVGAERGDERIKLIADRNIQSSISWDALNRAGYATGVDLPSLSIADQFVVSARLLSGGIGSADKDNEWDKYIGGSTLGGTITAGDNNTWNWTGKWSLTSTTAPAGSNSNSSGAGSRVVRGNSSASGFSGVLSSEAGPTNNCYRPVFIIELLFSAKYLFQDGTDIKKCVLTTGVLPTITSVSATTSYQGPPSNLVDGATNTIWWSNGSGPQSVIFELSSAIAISSVDLTSGDRGADAPASFNIYGSNNGSDYLLVASIASTGFNGAATTKLPFTFGNDTAFKYYKFEFYGVGGNWVQLSEVRILPTTPPTASGWIKVGEAPVTREMFDSDGMDDLSLINNTMLQQLVSLTPELLVWTSDTQAQSKQAALTAVPKGRLVFPTGDIILPAQGIDSLTLTAKAEGAGNVRIIASVNQGATWKSISSQWITVEPSNLADVKANGLSPAVFNSIAIDQWKELLGGSNKIRFAFYLEIEEITDNAFADLITITPKPVSDKTPTIQSIKIIYDELTIEGRLQDLERINAINLAKLNFKSNALLMSEKYTLHDMVIDTCQAEEMKSISSSGAGETTSTESAFVNPVVLGSGKMLELNLAAIQKIKKVQVR
ncbi:discoidin domain-containing protein (plasmid) [Paenibacillus rhizovicinus]|uniref:Discoidin domain-containing protein n=1 Tax=Paenibacillus rhizovicinus TaxID=2704463 RepID=A0A6C0PB33_9BACL|nr:discoidin domain-containing protein [Paenibacillus rhizovicinus]QHW35646.1 discoidin domain-containing protein [Paenibacillus rhizovicinus]